MEKTKVLYVIAGVAIASIFFFVLFFDTYDGEAIFRREGCIGCHSFKGQGGGAGPELTAVTTRRSDSWIRQQIKDPKSHNPSGAMPPFPHLSRKEVSAIIKYLKS